jgi:hypothetical protein
MSSPRYVKAGSVPPKSLAAHDAIAGGKSHIYEMLEEGVQSRQKLFFTDAVTQSKYPAKADQ